MFEASRYGNGAKFLVLGIMLAHKLVSILHAIIAKFLDALNINLRMIVFYLTPV
jgi:hypothetical protein